jgi:hypothetical protein
MINKLSNYIKLTEVKEVFKCRQKIVGREAAMKNWFENI